MPIEAIAIAALAQVVAAVAALWALSMRLRFLRDVYWSRLDRSDLRAAGDVLRGPRLRSTRRTLRGRRRPGREAQRPRRQPP